MLANREQGDDYRHMSPVSPVEQARMGHLAFWARPQRERVAAFAELRQLEHPRFEPFINNLPFAKTNDGIYALVRHADVIEASRNPGLFSSEPTANAIFDMPPWLAPFFDSMINMNGPRHSKIRKVVARAFTPRLLAKLETDLRARAGRIVDDVGTRDGGDFVTLVAQRLPTQVICDMMGVPEHQHDYVLARTNTIIGFTDPEYIGISRDYLIRHGAPGTRHIIPLSARLLKAGLDLIRLVRRLGEERAENPRDDLISALVSTNVDGERLTPREVGTFFILLLVAGSETTRNVIAHAVTLFTDHPDQRELLLADFDGRIAGAIEEIVRYVSPVIQFRRTVTEDCELNGHPFRAGDKLLLFYNSANRDEAVFPDPDRFDITRSPNPHLGFGGPGPHFCLGANLARREITVMLRELYTRLPDIRAVGEPEPLLSYFVNGIKRMPFTTGR
jgi:methyl-branched lipid omega-hydroxylase